MSGPKSSSYYTDPATLRRRMLEAERERERQLEEQHKRTLAEIQNNARRQIENIISATDTPCKSIEVNGELNDVIADVNSLINFGDISPDGRNRLCKIRDELKTIFPCTAEQDKVKLQQFKTEIDRIKTSSSAASYMSHIEMPVKKVASKTTLSEKVMKEYEEAVVDYITELVLNGEDNPQVEEPVEKDYESYTAELKKKTNQLREERARRTELEYIYETAAEVMEEMGYSIYGEKISSQKAQSTIFPIDESTAFCITSTPDGKLVYEVVGYNSGGIATEDMRCRVEEKMKTLCGSSYLEFEERMAQHGIFSGNDQRILPPMKQLASVRDINEYKSVDVKHSAAKHRTSRTIHNNLRNKKQ